MSVLPGSARHVFNMSILEVQQSLFSDQGMGFRSAADGEKQDGAWMSLNGTSASSRHSWDMLTSEVSTLFDSWIQLDTVGSYFMQTVATGCQGGVLTTCEKEGFMDLGSDTKETRQSRNFVEKHVISWLTPTISNWFTFTSYCIQIAFILLCMCLPKISLPM